MLFEKIELEQGEEMLMAVRKHWFVITAELLGVLLLALLPFTLLMISEVAPRFVPVTINLSSYSTLFIFFSAAWILLTFLTTFMVWTHYYLDLWIITDRRIIVIDQIHFFNRKVSSFRLERLQDIKVSINGLLATFLNFGTLRAQTASAAESNFMTSGLPDPRGIQSLIQKATDARLKTLQGTLTQGVLD